MAASRTAPAAALDVRRVLLSLAGILLSILLAALEQTIVGTALPRIVADLGGFEYYSWAFTAYLFTATAATPVAGKLSDLFGRKRLMAVGIVTFLIGSTLCAVAPTMVLLIVFRALQGIGAGVLSAAAFAAIGDLFPPAERGKWQGVIIAVFGVASLVGPPLGGYLTETVGWRWVFWLNLPLGAIALVVLLTTFPGRPGGRQRGRVDYPGAVLVTGATVPLLLALAWAGTAFPWASPQIAGLLLLAAVGFVAFGWVEHHAAEPIMPPDMFRQPIVTVGLAVSFLSGILLYGLSVYLPLYVQGVLGLSPGEAGAVIIPFSLSGSISTVLSGQLIARTGRYRRLALVGLLGVSTGSALLVTMTASTSTTELIWYETIVSVGMGLYFPVLTIALQNAVPYTRLGVVTSTAQFVRSVGAALGVAVLGALIHSRFAATVQAWLPADLTRQLEPQELSDLLDPQLLVRPGAVEALQAQFATLGPPASQSVDAVVAAQRAALALALQEAFVIVAVAALVSFALTLFLRERPLRRDNRLPTAATSEASTAERASVERDRDADAAVPPARR